MNSFKYFFIRNPAGDHWMELQADEPIELYLADGETAIEITRAEWQLGYGFTRSAS